MAKDPVVGKERTDRSDRERSDRNRGSGSRERSESSRDRERDRQRNRDDGSLSKRLRNEGEPRSGGINKSDPPHVSLSSTTFTVANVKNTTISPVQAPASFSSVGNKTTSFDDGNISINKKELYESATEYENNEAKRLLTSEAMTEMQSVCEQLEVNMQEIVEFKNTERDDEEFLEDTMAEGLMTIMSLRRLNRLMKLKLKCVKEDLLAVRTEVDSDHLLLQNLLYEATHLQSQVAAVQEYKGKDEEIELIPISQFFKEAPDKIAKPETTKNNAHLLRIARLEYEFVQRQKLTEDISTLEKEKELTAKSIEERQGELDSILPLLSNVLEATKPIQKIFGMGISAHKEQQSTAKYLPTALYVLFVQSSAFQEAKGTNSSVSVRLCGNVENAKELVDVPDEVEEDSDSDKEQDPDIEISDRRLLRKKSSICVSPEDRKKKLIEKHPLWIEWVVKSKEGDAILIQYFYLVKLRIITVKTKMCNGTFDRNKPSETEISTPEDILTELFPNDIGLESPNPANSYLLNKVDCNGFSDFINETGRPYKWAQKLGGVEFPESTRFSLGAYKQLDETYRVHPEDRISAMSIEKTLKSIRIRLSNQMKLLSQLKSLDIRNIQIPLAAKDLFPSKTSTCFKSWESISWDQYTSFGCTRDPILTGSVSEKNIFYKATLERGRATLLALVALCMDFPSVPPIFSVQLEQDGERRDATNDSALRDLEKEVNIYSPKEFEQWKEVMVSMQLQRLIQCTDIILETDFMLGDAAGPSEFGREKLFLRAAAGRNLRRPFKYFGTGGGYFSQRF